MSIALASLTARLPELLRARVVRKPGAKAVCQLPLRSILEQLPKGVVRFSFGQIRSGSPAEVFSPQADADQTLVIVPLEFILPVLPPAALTRRSGQIQVAIPSDIGAVFGPEAAKAAAAAPVAPAEPQEQAPAAPEPEVLPATEEPSEPAAASEFEAVSPVDAEPAAPIEEPEPAPWPAPAPAPEVEAEEPAAPAVKEPEPQVVSESPIRMSNLPPNFRQSAASVSPISSAPPAIKPVPLPRPPAPPPARPMETAAPLRMQEPDEAPVQPTAPPANAVELALESTLAQWPPALSQVLTGIGAAQFRIFVPLSELESQIARGRIAFSWSQLSQWFHPPLPQDVAALPIEEFLVLPLNELVPQFLAKRAKSEPRKQVEVEASIPNLFVGTIPPSAQPEIGKAPAANTPPQQPVPQPSQPRPGVRPPIAAVPPAPAMPQAAVAQPPPPSVTSPTPTPAAAAEAVGDLSVLFGQPGKQMWTPMEIVRKTAKLPGVSGALVALQDGLLVASELPGALNGENLAAFIPQMFARMGHYTRELKMSEPSSIMMVVNQVPFQIFKAGNVFFLAYGRAGAPLPAVHLQAVAAQLERQSQTT